MKKKPRVAIDLFSGAGGLSCGLIDSGIEVKTAVEIWNIAASTYRKNLKGSVIEKDIKNVKGKEILNNIGLRKGQLFLLAGCPPCQGFSSQQRNKKGEKDERNLLVFEFARLVYELRPLFILMENVPGMKKESKIFKKVVKELREYGYEIIYDTLNAADYGVPQIRKRLVLHGVRLDIYKKMIKKKIELEFPEKTHTSSKNLVNNDKLESWKTVRQTISDLPKLDAGSINDNIPNHFSAGLSKINLERIKWIRNHGGSRNSLPEELQLNCHKKKAVGYGDVYGIMDWDKPAPTLTGGCLSYSKGRFGHPEQDRAISAREAARLQCFDDKFVFEGNKTEISLQIGNAVPVNLAKASGDYFIRLGEELRII
ncbi:DNA cytosine methyltransferase [Proteiniborus sp. MB09-C3]|uniref:DNA cytosine methyltransferase n=1 Tax=Proteiniborus sp. MB09-C3 TaxID=3050072 RepID=UPI00255326F1|nr:DNA cytosine methyltransferase [Proteiniborus sp. MB09-C3]WIV11086.1 DNA cytosine methyltransferase [Proteiniborus sp. MB09-C3]